MSAGVSLVHGRDSDLTTTPSFSKGSTKHKIKSLPDTKCKLIFLNVKVPRVLIDEESKVGVIRRMRQRETHRECSNPAGVAASLASWRIVAVTARTQTHTLA